MSAKQYLEKKRIENDVENKSKVRDFFNNVKVGDYISRETCIKSSMDNGLRTDELKITKVNKNEIFYRTIMNGRMGTPSSLEFPKTKEIKSANYNSISLDYSKSSEDFTYDKYDEIYTFSK